MAFSQEIVVSESIYVCGCVFFVCVSVLSVPSVPSVRVCALPQSKMEMVKELSSVAFSRKYSSPNTGHKVFLKRKGINNHKNIKKRREEKKMLERKSKGV